MKIPTTRLSAVLKQLPTADFGPGDVTVLDVCFPEFLQEKQRMASYEETGIAHIMTAYQPRPVSWGRLRRFAGSPTLGPGRYWSVCAREDGFDGGCMCNELMTYWSEATMVWPDLVDTTLMAPERRASHPDFAAPRLGINITGYGIRRRLLRKDSVEELGRVTYVLPLSVKALEINDVLDLRIPEAQTWFCDHFVALEEEIGLEGHRSGGEEGPVFKTYKYRKLRDFIDLIPTLVVPGVGGSSFHQGVGAWLRSHGVAGLVYPSARCNADWQLLERAGDNQSGEYTIAAYGWNFVDYRGAGPAEWRSLLGRLSTWVMPMKAGISVERIEGDHPGWVIRGAEEAERRRVQLSRDLMLGKVERGPDYDPRGGYRRPYHVTS